MILDILRLYHSVQFIHSVMFNSLKPNGLQRARLPCPSPGACSNSCPLSQWCHPTISSSIIRLLLWIFPIIRVFSHESALLIRWPKYWSFSFSISPSNEYSGLISFRIDWFDLLAVKGTLKNFLQHHSSKPSVLWCFRILQFQFSRSVVSDSATPWIAACQTSLSITNTWSLPKLMSIESVIPSSHLILCCPLLLLPAIPPSIRVFSSESTLRMRWPKEFSLQLTNSLLIVFSLSLSVFYYGQLWFLRLQPLFSSAVSNLPWILSRVSQARCLSIHARSLVQSSWVSL